MRGGTRSSSRERTDVPAWTTPGPLATAPAQNGIEVRRVEVHPSLLVQMIGGRRSLVRGRPLASGRLPAAEAGQEGAGTDGEAGRLAAASARRGQRLASASATCGRLDHVRPVSEHRHRTQPPATPSDAVGRRPPRLDHQRAGMARPDRQDRGPSSAQALVRRLEEGVRRVRRVASGSRDRQRGSGPRQCTPFRPVRPRGLAVAADRPSDPRDRGHRFRILYAGAFYGDRVELGGLVFRGLRRFLDRRTRADAITFTYLGRHRAVGSCPRRRCTAAKISPRTAASCPRRKPARLMMRADLLLLLIPADAGGRDARGQALRIPRGGSADPGGARHGSVRDVAPSRDASGRRSIDARRHRRGDRAPVRGLACGPCTRRSLDDLASFTWASRAHELASHLDSLVSPGSRTDLVDPIEGVLA